MGEKTKKFSIFREDFEPDKRETKIDKAKHKGAGVIIAVLLVAVMTAGYFGLSLRKGTQINGTDVSGMLASAAASKLTKDIENSEIVIMRRDGEQFRIKCGDIGVRYKAGLLLSVEMGQNNIVSPVCDEKKLDKVLDESGLFSGEAAPQDAFITTGEDGGFVVQPEDGGNVIQNTEYAKDFISAAIAMRLKNMDLETPIELPDNAYLNPEVTSEDEKLVKTKDALNLIAYNSIDLDMGGGVTEKVCIKDYADIDMQGHVTMNDAKLKKFVKKLAGKYDTMWQDRTVRLPDGEVITVKSTEYDTFGYELDVEGTMELIKDAVKDGDRETFAAHYTGGATRNGNGNDVGDSYIIVDITNQVLVAVKDNEVLLVSDVTTGRETDPKWNTPQGIFRIWQHEEGSYLTGTTAAGDIYNQFVYYWMAFSYTGCGLHDAFWRSEFGGDLYHESGSYGCVNCPSYTAEVLFDNYDVGTPVLIYKDMPTIDIIRTYLKEKAANENEGNEKHGAFVDENW